jgi:hypothetical protein
MNAKKHQTKVLKNRKPLGSGALKARYLQCFGARTNNAAALQGVVKNLIDEGIPRQTLVKWAVEASYSKGYVSSLLSRILVSLGMRERKPGAGRKPSVAALRLLVYVQEQYGEDCLKVLRAAWRAGRAELAASAPSATITVPQLHQRKANYDTTIKRVIRPASRNNRSRHHSATIQRTFHPATGVSSKNRGLQ